MSRGTSTLSDRAVNTLLLAVSLALIYAAAEAYVSFAVDDGMQFDLEMWRYSRAVKRVSDNPVIGHEHQPNTQAHLMGVDVAISSQGLRDREFPLEPPPGRTRILMLGDSLTFGWGVPVEQTYSKRLEQLLRQGGHDVEVINTGVGNYNTSMEVEYFLERGAKFNPHYVVLNYFINDAEPTPRYQTSFLSRHSRAYVYFASRMDSALRKAEVAHREDWQGYYASLYKNGHGTREVIAAVGRLASYCRKKGIYVVLADYPELRSPAKYPFPYVGDFMRKAAETHGIPYISLLPAVKNLEPASLWVTVPDPHPSAVAHEAFAKELFSIFDPQLRARRQ